MCARQSCAANLTMSCTLLYFQPGNSHETRRKYMILGSAFFHRGQLVSSHLAPADLHDLGLYVQHLGLLDLTARNSVAQFVAWKEVYPTRFCQDIAEINSSFGYSEPNARWCCMIVGLVIIHEL